MRFLALAGLVAVASAGSVKIPFQRQSKFNHIMGITKRDGSIDLEALNNVTGGGYYAEFEVGTPGQKLSFLLDTGSSDTWVNAENSTLCNSDTLQSEVGYCMTTFDASQSNTSALVDQGGFDITYLDGRNIRGSYFNDTVTIEGNAIKNQQLGLAFSSVRPTGIMGLGFAGNVAAKRPYPTVVDNMLSQGYIPSAAFSLYLNDLDANSGTILFGGVDTSQFVGSLAKLPLQSDFQSAPGANVTSYTVDLAGFSLNSPKDDESSSIDTFSAPAVLDSGSTLSLLPHDQASAIYDVFDVRTVQTLPIPFCDCAWSGDKGKDYSFTFSFDGKDLKVPIREMVIDSFAEVQDELMNDSDLKQFFDGYSSVCMFGIGDGQDYGVGSGFALLGDTTLRSAYIVYDMANEQLGLAQANFNSSDSNVVEFSSDGADIPDVKGVSAADANTGEADGDSAAGHIVPFQPGPFALTVLTLLGAAMATL